VRCWAALGRVVPRGRAWSVVVAGGWVDLEGLAGRVGVSQPVSLPPGSSSCQSVWSRSPACLAMRVNVQGSCREPWAALTGADLGYLHHTQGVPELVTGLLACLHAGQGRSAVARGVFSDAVTVLHGGCGARRKTAHG
jgi:hypothetical protein